MSRMWCLRFLYVFILSLNSLSLNLFTRDSMTKFLRGSDSAETDWAPLKAMLRSDRCAGQIKVGFQDSCLFLCCGGRFGANGGRQRASETRFRPVALGAIALLSLHLSAASVFAQDLNSFGVLGGSTVTSTGLSAISGNVGVSPGSAVTGLIPAQVTNGTIHAADAVAGQAQSDLSVLYTVLSGRPTTQDLTGQDLGGKIFGPGVYHFDSIAPLNGTLTLDAGGNANAVFIFNIGSELITGAASTVMLINGAQGGNVFFVVGSSATLGSTTAFTGRILALTSISLNNGATITCGAALARNGAVTLISNTISIPDGTCMVALAAGAFGNALDAAATENERAVAAALDAFIAAGGTLPLGFQFFASTLTPAELALALKQLSGEAGTGTAPAGMQAMDLFLDLVSDAGYGGGSLAEGAAPDEGNTPAKGMLPAPSGCSAMCRMTRRQPTRPLPPSAEGVAPVAPLFADGVSGQLDSEGIALSMETPQREPTTEHRAISARRRGSTAS